MYPSLPIPIRSPSLCPWLPLTHSRNIEALTGMECFCEHVPGCSRNLPQRSGRGVIVDRVVGYLHLARPPPVSGVSLPFFPSPISSQLPLLTLLFSSDSSRNTIRHGASHSLHCRAPQRDTFPRPRLSRCFRFALYLAGKSTAPPGCMGFRVECFFSPGVLRLLTPTLFIIQRRGKRWPAVGFCMN